MSCIRYIFSFDIVCHYQRYKRKLFFQEYLGESDIIFKIYVIGRWLVSITSHNRIQQSEDLTPLELIHIRVPIDKKLKRRIFRMGRKFDMTVFGVDYMLVDREVYIVDINDFPSFRSIPEAVSLISDQLFNLITIREQQLQTLVKAKVE